MGNDGIVYEWLWQHRSMNGPTLFSVKAIAKGTALGEDHVRGALVSLLVKEKIEYDEGRAINSRMRFFYDLEPMEPVELMDIEDRELVGSEHCYFNSNMLSRTFRGRRPSITNSRLVFSLNELAEQYGTSPRRVARFLTEQLYYADYEHNFVLRGFWQCETTKEHFVILHNKRADQSKKIMHWFRKHKECRMDVFFERMARDFGYTTEEIRDIASYLDRNDRLCRQGRWYIRET